MEAWVRPFESLNMISREGASLYSAILGHSSMIQFEKGWVISVSRIEELQIYHRCREYSAFYPAARRFRRFFIFPKKARCVICAEKVPENIISQALLLGVKIRGF